MQTDEQTGGVHKGNVRRREKARRKGKLKKLGRRNALKKWVFSRKREWNMGGLYS